MNAEFLCEEVAHPHIVVACEEVYFCAALAQGDELGEEMKEAFGHDGMVFEPKIEDIAHEVEGLGLFGDAVQPLADAFFALAARLPVGRAEMKVGGEEEAIHVVLTLS